MNNNKMFYFKYFLYSILTSTSLFIPIRVLYLIRFGVLDQEISFLKVVFSFSIVLFEIPTGVISDKISRKTSLKLGSILFSLHAIVYILMPNFTGFVITQVLLGLSASLFSGTDSSLLYIYVEKYDPSKTYLDVKSKIQFYTKIVAFLYSVISSILFSLNYNLNFILTCMMGILAFIIVSSFPNVTEQITEKFTLQSYFSHVKLTTKVLFSRKNVVASTIYTSILLSLLIFNFEYYQILFSKLGCPQYYFGLIYSSFTIISLIGYRITPYIIKNAGVMITYISYTILIMFSFIFLYTEIRFLVLMAVFFQQVVFSSWGLIFENDILENVPENEIKSTFSSINSLIVSLFKMLIIYALSFVIQYMGLQRTYIVLSCISLLSILSFLFIKIRSIYVKH